MKTHALIALRGFLIVTFVCWNVRHVAELQYGRAFLTGGAVSLIWWSNARASSIVDAPYGKWCYAFGAATGTVLGMWLGS